MMQKKCVLQTQGYKFSFYFRNKTYDKDRVMVIVEFTLETSLGQILVRTTPMSIIFPDIQRLLTYFENHMISLKKDSTTDSYTFVNDHIDFQITALSGHYDPSGESYFSIQCMINIGRAHEGDCCTYVGGESLITFTKTQEFMSELQSVLDDFQNPDKYLSNVE
jgi:hypothetical protein